MASGTKALRVNTRERAVSTDIVRLQDFQQAAIAEVLRSLTLASSSELFSRGDGSVPAAAAAPMTAVILNGFLCRPQIGSANLYIDGGVMIVVDPDITPNADDSICKVVKDVTGVTTPGTISFLAAGAATRIDVVEVARVDPSDPSCNVESASRDIYNPATGLFSATSVPKATDGRVQYRIRRGAEGGGMPALMSGWLPLMVASVPVGATNWDGVTCFDVRPLYADRASHANAIPAKNKILDAEMTAGFAYEANGGTGVRKFVNGRVNAVYAGATVGGSLPAGGLDLSTNDYAVANFIAGMTDGWWSLYVAFPFALPRWCRYTPASVGYRMPSSFCGIPIASQQANDFLGAPMAALALPTNLGLSGTTIAAVRVFTGPCKAATKILPTTVDGSGWYSFADLSAAPTLGAGALVNANDVYPFDVVEGTHVPIGTKGVELYGSLGWTPAAAHIGLRMHFEQYVEAVATFIGDNDAIVAHSPTAVTPVIGDGASAQLIAFAGKFALAPSWPGAASPWTAHTWHFGLMFGPGSAQILAGTAGVKVARYRL